MKKIRENSQKIRGRIRFSFPSPFSENNYTLVYDDFNINY